jgi:Eco57I restriction-modification methylase
MARQSKIQSDIGFTAISVVGGLISPDKIAQIAAASPDAKTAESYACPKGTNLRDEIARYFRIGQAEWQTFSRIENPNFEQCTAFTKSLLEEVFGFESLQGPRNHTSDGHGYRISLEAKEGRVPIVVAPSASGDEHDAFKIAYPQFGDAGTGRAKRRPDALLQEWLNASEPALWGLVLAGDRLRLLRDNASFTRPAYIEADLGAVFRDEMFADFTALWLLIHATRFGNQGAAVTDCALERWRDEGVETGTAAREHLRSNVEEALMSLGQGFLDENPDLREKLDSGALTDQHLFEQLLRIVYRLIFIAVTEERALIHDPEAKPATTTLYADGYGFAHMRERSTRRTLRDPHGDVWEGARILFRALDKGQAKLGLPALGGIFDDSLTPDLNAARIANKHFLNVIYRLSFIQDEKARVRINWRDMATEELGSVYEGLLELVPTRTNHGRDFAFAGGDEARGNARKTSGSYYTPDSLVQALLDTALDPVLDKAEANGGADSILNLTVIDPACGSAHFLLGAARRMAERVALIRDSENPDFQHALRDVVRRCIYGVDRNPMAVELAKVALWIEAVEPGKPLGFLNNNVRCGDALLGVFDMKVLEDGIPDAAYKPLTGDDKDTAKYYKKANQDATKGQGGFDFGTGQVAMPEMKPMALDFSGFRDLPEDTVEQIGAKAKRFKELRKKQGFVRATAAANLYVAAFLLPKVGGAPAGPSARTVPTTEELWMALNQGKMRQAMVDAPKAARRARAFHWPLEFPDVMQRGGFDVVLGNPPWERIKLQEQEFFAALSPEIAGAPNKGARDKLIKGLAASPEGSAERALSEAFIMAKREAEAASEFVRVSGDNGGRFPLTGRGDVNTYALFAELFANLARQRAGVILPTGIATDATTAPFFAAMVERKRLSSIYSFKEIRAIFLATDDRNPFCMLTLGKDEGVAKFAFSLPSPAELADPERNFTLTPAQIARLNPNTKTAPIFRSRMDAELTARIYENNPVLIETAKGEQGNPWQVSFMAMFHMSNDSNLFRSATQLAAEGYTRNGPNWSERGQDSDKYNYVPLYEAKMVHQFDHRWAGYDNLGKNADDVSLEEKQESRFEPVPRYWVPYDEVDKRLKDFGISNSWLICFRGIGRAGDERTLIVPLIPKVGLGNSSPSIVAGPPYAKNSWLLMAGLNALITDYCVRSKVNGANLNFFLVEQFPILPPAFYTEPRLAFVTPKVLELTYTSQSLAPFARDLGHDGPPFVWDEERRADLRADLDAFYARAYGLTRDELRYILDPADVKGPDYPSETFRVLKEKEIRTHGEYRTRRLVLAAWDRMEANGEFTAMGM